MLVFAFAGHMKQNQFLLSLAKRRNDENKNTNFKMIL